MGAILLAGCCGAFSICPSLPPSSACKHMSSRLPLNGGRAMRAEGSDAQPGRDELQTRREAVLQDLQGLLDSEKARVQDELQHLMDEKWRRETEEWGAEQRRPASGAEEDQGEEEPLPSGWDSLPWSDGYRRAMARADERREERRMQLDEQGIIGDGTGMGAGWHLDRIDVRSELSGRGWSFPCGQWLDKSEGDGLIERELQAEALVVEPEPEAEAEPEPEAGRQK